MRCSTEQKVKVIETYKVAPPNTFRLPGGKKAVCHWGNQRADHVFVGVRGRPAGEFRKNSEIQWEILRLKK